MERSNKWQDGYIEDCKRWKKEIIDAIHDSGSYEKQRHTEIGVPEEDVQKKLQESHRKTPSGLALLNGWRPVLLITG